MNKRLEYLDAAKGVGAICVLLGHLQGVEIFLLTPYVLPMCQWIFSFHMPLFFIISGMLINYKNDISKNMKDIVRKRFRGLIIPYFWISFIQLAIILLAIMRGASTFKDAGVHIFHIFTFYGISVMWFLPALFAAEIIFIYIMQTQGKKTGVWVITVLGIIALCIADYQMNYEYVTDLSLRIQDIVLIVIRPFVAVTFVAIGYFGFNMYKDKEPVNKKEAEGVTGAGDDAALTENNSITCDTKNGVSRQILKKIGGILGGLALIYIGMVFMPVNMGVDFRTLVLKNEFFYYFCALTNSFGIILICKCINVKSIFGRILTFYGTNSLIFMFTHNSDRMLYYALNLSMWVNKYVTRARGYISYAVIALSMLAYTTVMIIIINRFFPFITGKPFKNPLKLKKNGENIG